MTTIPNIREDKLLEDGRSVTKDNLIAAGGFSNVFRGNLVCFDSTTVPVAIKEILKETGSQTASETKKPSKERQTLNNDETTAGEGEAKGPKPLDPLEIQKEIDALTVFQSNRYVVELIACFEHELETWIVTELCAANFHRFFPAVRSTIGCELEVGVLIHIIAPIVDAINFIHSMGYLHADIKSPNILINYDGIPKLADFGCCTRLDSSTGLIKYKAKGTDYHMAPELFREEPAGPKTDAFAFGTAISSLFVNVEFDLMFGVRTGAGLGFFFHENDPANMSKIATNLHEKIREAGMASGALGWPHYADIMCKLVEFEVEKRGSLIEVAADNGILDRIADWKKYPCSHENLSQKFLRNHAIVAYVLNGANVASSRLSEYLPYFKKDGIVWN